MEAILDVQAVAQKSPTINGNNLPHGDLASKVSRRRVTMATRKERFTKKSDEARAISSTLDLEQVPSSVASPTEPPAPPPSPVEDCRI
ncbi:myocilin opposite strand protein-like isoform X1 [Canis lupus familiaris]|uniref:myocilin opposite strand protein-like isoform X1 n=1 Tax=Canis lupus familiaris TaxID=9615 RepID=UPI0018F27D53|nr:myocilin opposite strand protein-like isoform X1 [Canis lupus familiaris]XP_038391393.1 myocilin opposite strand protein-like isoform X1 [Canis lupus familiaris]XP_038518314.1 myocilin opposite strand protein-like isoform X1 [Canis lupus familiaris]